MSEAFALSLPQQAVWFDQALTPDNACYVIGGVLQLDGSFHFDAWQQALGDVVRVTDAMRLVFEVRDDGVYQRVLDADAVDCTIRREDFRHHADGDARALCCLRQSFSRAFDLRGGPPWEMQWVDAERARSYVLLRLHHLVADGASLSLIGAALAQAYNQRIRGLTPQLPAPSYRAFVLSEQAFAGSPRFERHRAYWLQCFAQSPDIPFAPAAAPGRQPALAFTRDLDRAGFEHMAALAQSWGASMAHVLVAAVAVQVACTWPDCRRISLGMPIHGRRGPEERRTVGMFSSVMPLIVEVDSAVGFEQVVRAVARASHNGYRHQRFPFFELARALRHVSTDDAPLFDISVSVEQFKGDVQIDGGRIRMETFHNGFEDVALAICLRNFEKAADVRLDFHFDPARIDAGVAAATAQRIVRLMREGMARPQQPVAELPLLDAGQRDQLVALGRGEAVDWGVGCVHEAIQAQARSRPQGPALRDGVHTLSYAQLNAQANRLARHLLAQGLRPDERVAVALPRGAAQVLALLAVLKAGGCYVPLDPDHPVDRLAYMLDDSQPRLVITEQAAPAWVPEQLVLRFDARHWAQHDEDDVDTTTLGLLPQHLAYVIYTSGSTGRPKGVMVEHAGLTNYVLDAVRWFGLTPGEQVLQQNSLCFDLSLEELLPALAAGACVVCAQQPLAISSQGLGVDMVHFTAAHWHALVAQWDRQPQLARAQMAGVRLVNVTGEALSASALQRWQALGLPQLINTYGPTEAAVSCTAACIGASAQQTLVNIGRPFANTQIYILDGRGEPVPVGIPGELHIAGVQVGRGYLSQPQLTAQRFVADRLAPGGRRMYRTGDLARWREDGRIEYLGRNDHQVKLRGFRIEPGEIEAALLQQPGVGQAVVVLREDTGQPRQLVAYVVAQAGTPLQTSQLRAQLARELPGYMVPAQMMVLPALPLTPNGKLDRAALPPPQPELQPELLPPHTPTEQRLAQIWSQVLGRPQIGRLDDFFHLGGHSLLAIQVISQVRSAFGVELSLRCVFERPALAAQAECLDSLLAEGAGPAMEPLVAMPRQATAPLSFAQQRLWFLDRLEPGSGAYVMPCALRLRGPLDVPALRRTLDEVVLRHEVLRTRFVAVQGMPRQLIEPRLRLGLEIEDCAAEEVAERWQQQAQAPFDLEAGPLVRARLLRVAEHEHVLMFTMHHIVCDGWSVGVLLAEVAALYAAFRRGLPSPLPPLPIQYADYAAWQQRWLTDEVLQRQLAYWRGALAGAPALLSLPMARPRPVHQRHRGALLHFSIAHGTTAALNALARRTGATLFMALTAVFEVLLWRYSGQDDICIGTPVANRSRAEVESLVGFFVNTLVLRNRLRERRSFLDLLGQVKAGTLQAYANQDLPFEQLVEALRPQRSTSHAPLFQVMLTLQNTPMQRPELECLQVETLSLAEVQAKFDLSLDFIERDGELHGELEYDTDLFDAPAMQRLVQHLQHLCEAAASRPGTVLAELPLLDAGQRDQLVALGRGEAVDWGVGCVHEAIQAQARSRPQGPALRDGVHTLSYAQLNAQANRLARHLLAQGLRPDERVAVALPRGAAQVLALLAVLKAGGCYVPLDPDHPVDRLAYMLDDSQPRLVITEQAAPAWVPEQLVLRFDARHWAQHDEDDVDTTTLGLLPQHLAYVIYTSGSTGRPKGVMVEHAGLTNYVLDAVRWFGLTPGEQVLQQNSLCFDLSLEELLPALAAGACVVCAQQPLAISSQGLGVDMVHFTAAHWHALVAQWDRQPQLARAQMAGVRLVNVTGEALSASALQRWQALGLPQLINTYGPTEAAVSCTAACIGASAQQTLVNIGRPFANTQIYILDGRGEPVPVGIPGELHIAGVQVGRGYLSQPQLTAQRFVADRLAPGGRRMYRTGDLARWREDGRIEYLGRNDHQVKLRGFRIEPGEIEAALLQQPGVGQAVVVLREDTGQPRQLVAYVVAQAGTPLQTSQLRAQLARELPGYMVPAQMMVLPALPLTPNGKLDRAALPPPQPELQPELLPPHTPTEQRLAQIWSQVLGRPQIGRLDDFFHLGGHSLLAIQVLVRIRDEFGFELPVRTFFGDSTLQALGRAVDLQAEHQTAVPIASVEQLLAAAIDELDAATDTALRP